MPFDEVIELALYGDGGFYEGLDAGAGKRADFLTSPEVGPLFGAVVANALDQWWEDLGRPDPFVVVEAGAGPGTLARSIRAAAPACRGALRYVLVDRAEAQRARQEATLPLEPAGWALGPVVTDDPDEGTRQQAGTGPVFTALAELPAGPVVGVVLANELLDNLPFRLLEKRADGWSEVRVADDGERFAELLVAAEPHLAEQASSSAPDAPVGGRIPIQGTAVAWLRSALGLLSRGRVVTIDYASSTADMAARPGAGWLRTYRRHAPGTHPLDDLGGQDITSEVAVDQLATVAAPASDRSQDEFLRAHGIDVLREEAAAAWQARAHIGDLEAVKARSRVSEADALTDPTGLGAFRVLEWAVPGGA